MAGDRVRLEFELDGKQVALVLGRATAHIGMKRSIAAYNAIQQNKDEPDEALRVLRQITYPDLVYSVIEAEGIDWPISFEDFIELPDQLIDVWQRAAYKVNPHWNPAGEIEDESAEKKDVNSTEESPAS